MNRHSIYRVVIFGGLLLLAIVACTPSAAPPTESNESETLATVVAATDAAATESAVVDTTTGEDEAAELTTPTGDTETADGPLPDDPVEAAIEKLLRQMTLAEKIGQMTLVEKNSIDANAITELGIGGVLSGGGGYPARNSVAAWQDMVGGFQDAALASRLGIPLIYGVDAVHGHNNLMDATIFPHNIGLGATHDPDLVRRVARATAEEMVATGIRWNYAPVLAVVQDIRWGRTYEGFSDDTALVTELGSAYLLGLQDAGDGLGLAGPQAVLGTPKHFMGDGGTSWGTSESSMFGSQYMLDQGDTQVDEATLRELYLPPYARAVEDGAMSVMATFSSWNGVKVHGLKSLLTVMLKDELGFSGFVVSDWGGVDQVDRDYYAAVVQSVNAGVDMNMVPYDYSLFIATLTKAVEQGDVSMERIDDAVRRILRAKFSMNLFELTDRPGAGAEAVVGSAANRELAREAVRKSLVLLQNENETLPLDKDTPLIFLAGEGAFDIGMQSGGWTIEWQGSPGEITAGTTIREAIQAAVGPDTQVAFNRLGNFEREVDDAGNPATADVGIVVLAEKPYAEGVGDRADLTLSDEEYDLIQAVGERSEKLVVILLSGRPLIITEELPLADAWVAAWLPGTEGQGVADVLFGDYQFTGRLSYEWPAANKDIPLSETGATPLFERGFGLETK